MLPVRNVVLQSATTLLTIRFADLLLALLEERQLSRAQLYDFVFAQGCHIDQTAMYRYFNREPKSSRLPAGEKGQQFLELFAAFLKLSEQEYAALMLVWQIQRRQRRKNGVGRIEVVNKGAYPSPERRQQIAFEPVKKCG
jgi:hypothetical protein